MANVSYLVIRIHPDSPVNSGEFGRYLNGLQVRVYPADAVQDNTTLLGQIPAGSGLPYQSAQLIQVPWSSDFVLAVAKSLTATPKPVSQNDFGNQMTLDSVAGIPFGASVTNPADTATFPAGTHVTDISSTGVTISKEIAKAVGTGSGVAFYYQYAAGDITVDPNFGSCSINLKTSAATSSPNPLKFLDTSGVAIGMGVSGTGIPAGTKVTGVTGTTVTLSNSVSMAKNVTLTFSLDLNSGIVQHVEQLEFDAFIETFFVPIPASVATAIVPLTVTPPVNSYLDVAVVVVRDGLPIPVQGNFYNVLFQTAPQLPKPSEYQPIPLGDTSLYLTLPAPPINLNAAVGLTIPTDGSAPKFDQLVPAMQTAIQNDPFLATADILQLTPDQCTRLAYDIVWSLQNTLPLPPDPLEQLYTNPPNTGGSKASGGGGDSSNGDEQDRQKFEGTISSFYSTRNATAVRLAKFVAAASGALYCEDKSVKATQALLEFPVDPDLLPEPAPVESEVLLTGLTPTGVNFGVPAGFFYALGTGLDKSSTGDRRYQIACGERVVRILQQFEHAVQAQSIGKIGDDSEGFCLPLTTPFTTHNPITAAQAARRLAALKVTASSTSPVVTLPAPSAFTDLVNAWLGATTKQPTYRTYQPSDDDTIFALLVLTSPPAALQAGNYNFTLQPTEEGYLLMILSALTQGYLIPGAGPQTPLAVQIDDFLPSKTIAALKAVTVGQWRTFFTANPTFIPPFVQPAGGGTPTQPAYIATCIKNWVRAVQRFFTVSSLPDLATPPTPGAAANFGLPPFDAVAQAVANLPAGFQFGAAPLTTGQIANAVAGVFSPGTNTEAEAWLGQAIATINELYQIARSVVTEITPNEQPLVGSLAFSVMEALYARGFRSAQDITALSAPAFQQATTGSVAYQWSIAPNGGLYKAASAIAPPNTVGNTNGGGFTPINPDGSLTNCIPPLCLSPLGPVAYLNELLQLSQAGTCEDAFATLDGTSPTLGTMIGGRRGPLGDLLASCANLETPVTMIDIVNECLENVAATAPAKAVGIVHDTADKLLAGYALCEVGSDQKGCHQADQLLATVPQWSSPATPVAQPVAYSNLANDFSSPCLPYSQPLDISRSYLQLLCTCRSDTMRTFRQQITEFVWSPDAPPTGFQDYLWRYPVRLEIAVEYLGFTPQEFATLFAGTASVPAWQLFGFAASTAGDTSWSSLVSELSQFLERTCLTYCEFLELQKCGFVQITRSNSAEGSSEFPACEPCCLDNMTISFGDTRDPAPTLVQLAVFIRLWRKLKRNCSGGYTFEQLADICGVLGPLAGGLQTAEFIRQLAAFQMLRDNFDLRLSDTGAKPAGTGADRTQLLALWVGPSAASWTWAVTQLLERVPHLAHTRHKAGRRLPEVIKILADNLDPISRLIGFNPDAAADTWHSRPACTLRFAEVLVKIYASSFTVGDILYLATAEHHLDSDDAFPLQSVNEANDLPLGLPEDEHADSLSALRHKLLAVEITEEQNHHFTWTRVTTTLRDQFGYAPDPAAPNPDPLLSLGKHFFPRFVTKAGITVTTSERRYTYAQAVATPPLMWNSPPDGPFQCETAADQSVHLWSQIPLCDEAVINKLCHVHSLGADEQVAVQDLYFQPRLELSSFAFLFPNFADADRHLIQEPDEERRWAYFTRHLALTQARCKVIAEHLASHVRRATGEGQHDEHDHAAAWLVLRSLLADENAAVPPAAWQDPSGKPPIVTWNPRPSGGAFAALLGLTGTGVLEEIATAEGQVIWRDIRGPFEAFGAVRNARNAPVPTVMPDMCYSPSDGSRLVSIRNGFAARDVDGAELGGAQSFRVSWIGALLIEDDGRYEFRVTWLGEEEQEQRSWRVILKRGQKTWLLLKHRWQEDDNEPASAVPLRRGAYELRIEFIQSAPDFSNCEDAQHQHTGFELDYRGPDSCERWEPLPLSRLFLREKTGTLGQGIERKYSPAAMAFLQSLYTSSLRDIRRTYQRAFKALLLVDRFDLSAKPAMDGGHSELGYMLAKGDRFAGAGFARTSPTSFATSLAYFDFNLLPLRDSYLAPAVTDDPRVSPAPARVSALFDWWERLFDYTQVRRATREHRERPIWLLFDEAMNKQPAHVGFLLRHLGIDARHEGLLLNYYAGPMPGSLYSMSATDLGDERWVVRIWHGEEWIRKMLACFCPADITQAKPALWAADDPSMPVKPVTSSGNQNLTGFVDAGYFGSCEPRRYGDIKLVNDCLRERARDALVTYLSRMNRVPLADGSGGFASAPGDLSDYLLIDVDVGVCERASRIEGAVSCIQTFVRRARLGLEPTWTVSREFGQLWDGRFATFKVWEACKRRELYRENYVDWKEIECARRVEAFRLLESQLQCATLSIAEPGGCEWWPDPGLPQHDGLTALQRVVPSSLTQLPAALPTPENLTLLGTPERDARLSWLAAPSVIASQPPPPPNGEGDKLGTRVGTGRLAMKAAQTALPSNLPFWLESAIRLGTQFIRVAAAGEPAAAAEYVADTAQGKRECCAECGCVHLPSVDEYYFWLINAWQYEPGTVGTAEDFQTGIQNSYYDSSQQQSAYWNDPSQVPALLHWPATPAVRLAWCRVHNGEFSQPRRSAECVELQAGANLQLVGRGADSLFFAVGGAAPPSEGYTDPSPSGFRYDLPTDDTVSLPLPVVAPLSVPTYPGGLPAYPFFSLDAPGAPLFPQSIFAPALVVASALRTRCRFDVALKWYELAFAPLQSDCTWISCSGDPSNGDNAAEGQPNSTAPNPDVPPVPLAFSVVGAKGTAGSPVAGRRGARTGTKRLAADGSQLLGACCDSTAVGEDIVRNRAVTLHYCDTLLEWGSHLMRRWNSPEAFQQARLLFDTVARITGRRPRSVLLEVPNAPPTVSSFEPATPPLNPRLLAIYERTADQLGLIHACADAERIKNGRLNADAHYFADRGLREDWHNNADCCAGIAECCNQRSPYRFTFLLQKALELAGGVREFGAALLAAYEKGDAEYVASLRAEHERELSTLQLAIRQEQWRDADWQIQALQQTKDLNQTNLVYFTGLYQSGMVNDEIQHEVLATTALQTRTGAGAVQAVGEAMKVIPDLFVGFPCNDSQVPIGTKLAGVFETIARVMNVFADIQSSTAALDLTLAGWQRRSDEWLHQTQTLPIEIEQIELQILGAQRRRDVALRELNNLQRQIEHSVEIMDFLRDKFTADQLYLWMQKETSALHHRMYDLALCAARQAERAFNFERGHTTRRFVPERVWDTLHEGLLAGERLEFALRHMEKAYCDENVREHELTKHISLRLHFPGAYLRLRTTGYCEIEIPEWMFDLDYPGHYMRRIKNVALTLPCITGPYTGVHCRLTLLSSETRIEPTLRPPPLHCCRDHKQRSDYEACPDDPRMVRQYAARECIATSSGQNDSGLFELNFRDDRYLPFEYLGAISRWRIELPPENNYFDLESLSDVIVHLNYTSREGDPLLRRAANAAAQRHLPAEGWSFFDIRNDFPDSWQHFRDSQRRQVEAHPLDFTLRRDFLPFVPGNPNRVVSEIALVFETEDCVLGGCSEVGVLTGDEDECEEIRCVPSKDWPGLKAGSARVRLVSDHRKRADPRICLRFPKGLGEIRRVFLFCKCESVRTEQTHCSCRLSPCHCRATWGSEQTTRPGDSAATR